jgi:hypothetical protein
VRRLLFVNHSLKLGGSTRSLRELIRGSVGECDLVVPRDEKSMDEAAMRAYFGPNVRRIAVGVRVHGNRAQAESARRANDPAGDLATIGNQDALEHRGYIRKMPYGCSPGSGFDAATARASANT